MIEFYVERMGEEWEAEIEEIPMIDLGTGRRIGTLRHALLSRGSAIVNVNADNMDEGGPHTYEIAIDQRGERSD